MKTNGKKQSSMREKGQVLVIVGLTIMMLMAIIGLAVDTGYVYVSYSRLRRAVDAAALAATGEFKRGYTITGMRASAMQQLRLNGVVTLVDTNNPDVSIIIETCDQNPGDIVLCPADGETAKKLVRIRVTQNVPMFFLSAWGFARVPITIESISQAASIDLILLIQNSETMAHAAATVNRDPSVCNPHGCHPFEEVKAAAFAFVNTMMYFPYDRVSIVTFNKTATLNLELTDDGTLVAPALNALTVFDPGACPWGKQERDDWNPDDNDPTAIFNLPGVPPAYPHPNTAPLKPYVTDPYGPCRLYNSSPGSGYKVAPSGDPTDGLYTGFFDCPMFWATDATGARTSDINPSWCGTTNPAAGLVMGGNHLQGVYPTGWTGTVREDAVWVILLLATGAPNSAQDNANQPVCPVSTRNPPLYNRATCRDNDVTIRHCFKATDTTCLGAEHDILGNGVYIMKSFHNPTDYDAYDRAFDMIDTQVANSVYIFTISLGDAAVSKPVDSFGNLSPGQTFLEYGAKVGGGIYRHAPDAEDLQAIFLEIANKIATKLTQ